MPEFAHPQGASPDVRRADPQGILAFSKVPAGGEAFLGKALLAAGAVNVAGAYAIDIRTDDLSVLEVTLMPSAVTGTFAPSINRMWANGEKVRSTTAGSNFAAGTDQTLSLSALNGTSRVRITFTVPGSGSVTFAPGSDPTALTALAEWNGA